MSQKLILGVDGGNTKTDFYLFSSDGEYISSHHCGTCSHENLGYDGAKNALQNALLELCSNANINISEISSAVLGLAGVDIPIQQHNMDQIIKSIGLINSVVCNDSFLGVKAATKNGIGVCSINGTGTVAGGIDINGNMFQVGGIGSITSDCAGGGYLAKQAVSKVYDEYCRCGEKTLLTPFISRIFNISDKHSILNNIHETNLNVKRHEKEICVSIFKYAKQGDIVCENIILDMAKTLAMHTSGCISNLEFDNNVNVVLAGSVWVKCDYLKLVQSFKSQVQQMTNKKIELILLKQPPACGAVLWAYENLYKKIAPIQIKNNILDHIMKY